MVLSDNQLAQQSRMREVSFAGTVIDSARLAGGGAGWPVTAGHSNRGTRLFAAEPERRTRCRTLPRSSRGNPSSDCADAESG